MMKRKLIFTIYTENNESLNVSKNLVIYTETNQHTAIDRYDNGLLKDILYYIDSKTVSIIIEHYFYKESVNSQNLYITSEKYATIFNNGWFNGCVIDANIFSFINDYNGITYISTDDSIRIISNMSKDINSKSKFCTTTKPLQSVIVMVYL